MPHLETGVYTPAITERVTVWKAPDADGDGKEVWKDEFDLQGNPLGRSRVKDENGKEVFEYEPPEGFRNVQSKEAGADGRTDCYVRVDDRGRIWRHPRDGRAAEIRPGTVLVERSNGDFELLTDEYSQYLYAKSHERAGDNVDDVQLVESEGSEERDAADQERADREEFEAWKAERAKTASEGESK